VTKSGCNALAANAAKANILNAFEAFTPTALKNTQLIHKLIENLAGGDAGIRTLDTLSRMTI